MNVSPSAQLPATQTPTQGREPYGTPRPSLPAHAGMTRKRGARLAENARRLPMRVPVDPDDAAVFRALLCERGGKQPDTLVELSPPHAGWEQLERRPGCEDENGRATARQADTEPREDMSIDRTSLTPRDLDALARMVTKVYLDGLHDERRTMGLALNEDLLPATRLSVEEREGRLAVDFVSIDARARDRLRRGAATLANRIAADLSRDVAVKVAAHDGDRQPLEARADAAPVPRRESMA